MSKESASGRRPSQGLKSRSIFPDGQARPLRRLFYRGIPRRNLFLLPDYNMSSVGALLVGTPAKINPDLLSDSGVLVDSVNGLHGDVLLAAGTGMSVATNAGTNTVTYTNAGVTSAVAGTGIAVSGATGAVTISAPNLLPKQTAFTVSRVELRPAGALPTGATTFGATFGVPATGLYLVEVGASFNSSAVNGVTVGASDWIGVAIETVPAGGAGAGSDLKPWTVPAADGNDYAVSNTEVAVLTQGVTYQAYYYANVSGGITLPDTTFYVEITSLCA